MITERDLQEAIAECEGQRNPNANTCIKLAAFYTIRQHMFGNTPETYSFDPGPRITENVESSGFQYDSGTEFSDAMNRLGVDATVPIVDELMTTLSVINPRLYAGVMRKMNSPELDHTH